MIHDATCPLRAEGRAARAIQVFVKPMILTLKKNR
jgi:hypothetical protein